MSDSHCFRVRKSKARKNVPTGLPGIPPAPVMRRKGQKVAFDFQGRKIRLIHKLPIYTLQDIQRIGHPYHIIIINSLIQNGYTQVVKEINGILAKEENEIFPDKKYEGVAPLLSLPDTFRSLADTLKFCQDLLAAGKGEQVLTQRIELAVKMMKQKEIWLARELLRTTLYMTRKLPDQQQKRFQAEMYCLLAFLIRLESESMAEVSVVEALSDLRKCRYLSVGEAWHFRPGVMKIKLKKPITLHGIRSEEYFVDGSSLSLYMAASLLEQELLFELAKQILFRHDTPLEEDVVQALQIGQDALNLALEVREPEAVSCALVRYGILLRDSGAYLEAMNFFEQLQIHAELKPDKETEAISFYLLGTCYNGQLEPLNALEMFVLEIETAESIDDLEAEAAVEIGKTLLCEGQTIEAKDCFGKANQGFCRAANIFDTPNHRLNDAWILDGISHGQNLWGRLAGLARRRTAGDIRSLIGHKLRRENLPHVRRPHYNIHSTMEAFSEYYSIFGVKSKDGGLGTSNKQNTALLEYSNVNKGETEKSVVAAEDDENKDFSTLQDPTKTKATTALKASRGKSGRNISFMFERNDGGIQPLKNEPQHTKLSEVTDASGITDFSSSSKSQSQSGSGSGSSSQTPQNFFDNDMDYASDGGRVVHDSPRDSVDVSSSSASASRTRTSHSTMSGSSKSQKLGDKFKLANLVLEIGRSKLSIHPSMGVASQKSFFGNHGGAGGSAPIVPLLSLSMNKVQTSLANTSQAQEDMKKTIGFI